MVRPVDRLMRLLRRPLPAPPERFRRGPFRRGAFGSEARGPRLTSQLGVALGLCFAVCFATGLLSHFVQRQPSWFWWPSRPVGLYRLTQGIHVATGLATIPLLTAKIWSVYPKLFAWPPLRDVLHAVERLTIFVLVAAGLFQVLTGLLNITYWYGAMPFAFLAGHYWGAWLAIGAILVHVAVKLPVVREALARRRSGAEVGGRSLPRRAVLGAVAATVTAVTATTVGQTVAPLRGLALLAPRRPDIGPQGIPVNTSAIGAGVVDRLDDPGYRLVISFAGRRRELSVDALAALPQTTAQLPIACVEGWSASAEWTGVRIADLLALVGAPPTSTVAVVSLQRAGDHVSVLKPPHTGDPLTLLALRLNGERLHPDHGYPARLIAPNRPGSLQTKWVAELRVLS
jgi:hypothetical protein